MISESKADTFEYIKIISDAKIVYNEYSPEPKDSEFLKDYYFENHKSLIESLEHQFENEDVENEYLDYLITKVIDSLPKYEKYVK